MKKSYMPISDVKNESLDLTKRLYKCIADVVKALDEQRQKANSVPDLFTQAAEAQRMKLREYCEKLMFLDPVGCGRKGEELLWRKGYYEVVSTAKRLHKGPLWKPVEECHLRAHLQAGIGHYHHLLLKFQLDFKMDLRGIIDFPLIITEDGLKKSKSSSSSKDKPLDPGCVEWAQQAVHRCLIYLGDLSRYLSDMCPGYHSELPARYYHQALYWKPECGMPHNQLGTLVGNYNFFLDSAYHYMRCLSSAQSFEGTESNLSGVLERSWKHYESTMTPSPVHHLVSKFLSIVDFCYFDKQSVDQFPLLCHEAIERLNCTEMLQCTREVVNGEGEDNSLQPAQLTDDILFKLTLVSVMCTQQLQGKGSDQMNVVMAVMLAVVNYLILKAVGRLEEVLPPPQPPPLTAVNGHKRRRRLRRRRHSSEVSSDISDEEEVLTLNSDSDLSEEELVFDTHSSDSDSEPAEVVVAELDTRKVQLGDTPALSTNTTLDHVEHLCQQGFLLQTIKICLDWMVNNHDVLRACAQTVKPMLGRTVAFLNHLTVVPLPPAASERPDVINNGVIENERIPLVEEVSVRGLLALKPAYQHIDWAQLKTISLTPRQEAYVRVCKLVQLGKKLASADGTDLNYDQNRNWFQLKDSEPPTPTTPTIQIQDKKLATDEKGRLMKDMGQLWLKAEVKELETKVRRTSSLPPYLVLDCEALIHHITLVKQLVHSRKFIILVPSIVVSSLDEQKRASRRVRDTIRWLETQFQRGNRFLRAQRPNEHLALPLIKYPKKKDKEAWMFFQVAECCHFMSQQQQATTDKDTLVTLLTGSRTLLSPNTNNGFSPLGIANTAGTLVIPVK
ncbi:nonsense-mediated mRNA decay factor SMG5-like [Macrosteles quadrilineatus]|uniref:nonsense-mediated mRNA decay factor SMG5-like n=1 Tax=Macrosteles quadrilineatus TaxID=74068 RepID=UPI0023E0EABE|nr:nonsense-mediated mRNA decay factor SMG5-like [Macrosteles quadrilineatus]